MNPVQQLFQKIWLKIHLKIHTEERPYWCTYGNKALHVILILSVIKWHTQRRSNINAIVTNLFSLLSGLKFTGEHNGGKPYQCIQCDKAYSGYNELDCYKRVDTRVGRSKYINVTIVAKLFSFIIWFKNSHENTHWRKNMSMHPLWQGLLML